LIDITEKDGSVTFKVCVVPRSSKSEVVGEHYRSLKVRLTAPPVDGAANAELIKVLAKYLGVAKRDIDIVAGETSKNKRVSVTGADPGRVAAILHGKK
jgi:uncharacterized protein (TIGR00251 family)